MTIASKEWDNPAILQATTKNFSLNYMIDLL